MAESANAEVPMKSNLAGIILVALSTGCSEAPSPPLPIVVTPAASSEVVPEPDAQGLAENDIPTEVDSPVLPADVSYEIIKHDVIPNIKRSVDVRLNKRVPEDVLIQIAHSIRGGEPDTFERTFIGYYLPYHKPNDVYWATTNFTPDLEVRIIGMKADNAKKLVEDPSDAERSEIGRWLDESSFHKRVTIFRKNGKLYMEDTYEDGSGNVQEIRSSNVPLGTRFDKLTKSPAGDHWIFDTSGNLQIHDNEGWIYTAQRLQ